LQLAASTVLLDVVLGIRQALAAPLPRLLDEWQVEPALWNQGAAGRGCRRCAWAISAHRFS
jgi:hypothetical protein